jgi:hypothetical protein
MESKDVEVIVGMGGTPQLMELHIVPPFRQVLTGAVGAFILIDIIEIAIEDVHLGRIPVSAPALITAPPTGVKGENKAWYRPLVALKMSCCLKGLLASAREAHERETARVNLGISFEEIPGECSILGVHGPRGVAFAIPNPCVVHYRRRDSHSLEPRSPYLGTSGVATSSLIEDDNGKFPGSLRDYNRKILLHHFLRDGRTCGNTETKNTNQKDNAFVFYPVQYGATFFSKKNFFHFYRPLLIDSILEKT